jgi:hypothetical protein
MLLGLATALVAPQHVEGGPAPDPGFSYGVEISGDEAPGVEAVSGQTSYIAVSGDARE